jgi:hypothetical protein
MHQSATGLVRPLADCFRDGIRKGVVKRLYLASACWTNKPFADRAQSPFVETSAQMGLHPARYQLPESTFAFSELVRLGYRWTGPVPFSSEHTVASRFSDDQAQLAKLAQDRT